MHQASAAPVISTGLVTLTAVTEAAAHHQGSTTDPLTWSLFNTKLYSLHFLLAKLAFQLAAHAAAACNNYP